MAHSRPGPCWSDAREIGAYPVPKMVEPLYGHPYLVGDDADVRHTHSLAFEDQLSVCCDFHQSRQLGEVSPGDFPRQASCRPREPFAVVVDSRQRPLAFMAVGNAVLVRHVMDEAP